MRAVERTPWAEQRGSRHDEMCALVAAHPERVFPKFSGDAFAIVEAPIANGYADLFVTTDAPQDEQQHAIVEVKTNDERWSAGDAIRQLKWYKKNAIDVARPRDRGGLGYTLADFARRDAIRLVLVVDAGRAVSSSALSLLLHERIDVLPVCLFTGEKPCRCWSANVPQDSHNP